MTKKIFRSIFLVAGVVFLAGFVLILGILYRYFGGVQESQLETELMFAAEGVEADGVGYLEKLDPDECRLTWVAADGTVLFDSKSNANDMENHADREEIKEALENGTGESLRYSATLVEKTLYCAARLSDGTVLRVSVSRKTVFALVMGMMQPILFVFVIAIIFSALLAKGMSKRIARPLNALNLDSPLENNAYDELSPLLMHMEQQQRKIRRQKEELEERKNEFYAVIRNMGEGLVLLNRKDVILSMNPAAMTFFLKKTDCTGREFFLVERNHDIYKALGQAKLQNKSEARVSRFGREYQLNFSRIGEGEEASGIVILIFDITERAFAEQNRREFTANVSHELKTPLQSIMGSAELIENGLVQPEDMPRFVGHIRKEAARMVTLIEDIIRLSQLDEKNEMPMEEVDLYALAQKEVANLLPAAEEKHVTVTLTGGPAPVYGVPQLLHEVVDNLCDNAVKYNVDGGSVEVSVTADENGTSFLVSDTGIGIPYEDQERVFERFYRVEKSHSKETGGTGLGLSIVKHAVQCMGGELRLASEPGKGTKVEAAFPKV